MARRAPEAPRPALTDDDEKRPGHTHRLPKAVLATLVVICTALAASIVLVSLLAVQAQHQADLTNQRLEALEAFISERTEARNRQYRTLDQRITDKVCDVLEALPQGGLLDEVRTDNGCGPGVPIEDLPAAVQDEIRSRTQQPLVTDNDKTLDDYYATPNR